MFRLIRKFFSRSVKYDKLDEPEGESESFQINDNNQENIVASNTLAHMEDSPVAETTLLDNDMQLDVAAHDSRRRGALYETEAEKDIRELKLRYLVQSLKECGMI